MSRSNLRESTTVEAWLDNLDYSHTVPPTIRTPTNARSNKCDPDPSNSKEDHINNAADCQHFRPSRTTNKTPIPNSSTRRRIVTIDVDNALLDKMIIIYDKNHLFRSLFEACGITIKKVFVINPFVDMTARSCILRKDFLSAVEDLQRILTFGTTSYGIPFQHGHDIPPTPAFKDEVGTDLEIELKLIFSMAQHYSGRSKVEMLWETLQTTLDNDIILLGRDNRFTTSSNQRSLRVLLQRLCNQLHHITNSDNFFTPARFFSSVLHDYFARCVGTFLQEIVGDVDISVHEFDILLRKLEPLVRDFESLIRIIEELGFRLRQEDLRKNPNVLYSKDGLRYQQREVSE